MLFLNLTIDIVCLVSSARSPTNSLAIHSIVAQLSHAPLARVQNDIAAILSVHRVHVVALRCNAAANAAVVQNLVRAATTNHGETFTTLVIIH